MSLNSLDTQISKTLSYVLRHGAQKEGVPISSDGFVKLTDILAYRRFKTKITKEDVLRIVQNCPKQRFLLNEIENELFIRANQGHSLKEVKVEMREITEPLEVCLHGTYLHCWESIRRQGLSRMNRQHIHFTRRHVGSSTKNNGMRSNCQIIIYIDTAKALKDGIKFYESLNEVILSDGDENGFLLSKYFLKVVNLKTRQQHQQQHKLLTSDDNLKENTFLTTTSNYQLNNLPSDTQTTGENLTNKTVITQALPLSETLLYDPKLTRRGLAENYVKPVTERETWWRVEIKETPAPQAYETTKNSFLVDIAKKPNTYSFKSDGRRLDPVPQIGKGDYLLPGSYEYEDLTDRIARMKVTYGFKGPDRESLLERSLQGFRDKTIHVSPNAYQVEKYFRLNSEPEPIHHAFFKSKTKRRVFMPRDGPPPGCYELPEEKKPHAVSSCFKSKTSRFQKSHTATPGPGSYWPLTQWPVSKSVEKLGDKGVYFTPNFKSII